MRVFILSSERRPLTEQKKRERKVDIKGDRHEQVFLVQTINALEKTRQWESMAIVIAFDDSDGDYDHQMSPIFNGSSSPLDALSGTGICGSGYPSLGDAELRWG